MDLILFMGIQASGKSTFYRERLFDTHVRVNLDMLKTRHREKLLVEACLEGQTPFVVDNTNLTRKDRERYLLPAKEAGFSVRGFFFQSKVADSISRNALRTGKQRVPEVAIRGSSRRLELPSAAEGFDSLAFVRIENGVFVVEAYNALG